LALTAVRAARTKAQRAEPPPGGTSLQLPFSICDFRILHRHTQLSTVEFSDSSCQENWVGLLSRQIEPGSFKNFAAQLNEGAAAARLLRPQFFGRSYT